MIGWKKDIAEFTFVFMGSTDRSFSNSKKRLKGRVHFFTWLISERTKEKFIVTTQVDRLKAEDF